MPPAHPRTGQRNAAITHQLVAWTEADGRVKPSIRARDSS